MRKTPIVFRKIPDFYSHLAPTVLIAILYSQIWSAAIKNWKKSWAVIQKMGFSHCAAVQETRKMVAAKADRPIRKNISCDEVLNLV